MFSDPRSFAQAKIADEAIADIEGWNTVIDAGQQQNGGKPLTVPQAGYMLTSLRYRAIFIKAGSGPQKIEYNKGGGIDPTPQNIGAMSAALSGTGLLDFE